MVNEHVISMPDKWEYPWYAAWDLAFHSDCAVDGRHRFRQGTARPDAAGVLPASHRTDSRLRMELQRRESAGSCLGDDLPVSHGEPLRGEGDMEFLKRSFSKLMLNFSWWVNRKDRFGRNVFEGGFLGLDNIGVFDRSAPLPTGGYLEQADGTAWMTLFCQNMVEIAIELAAYDPFYEDMAVKFADHLLWIAHAMNRTGPGGMWDEEDGFYYDVSAASRRHGSPAEGALHGGPAAHVRRDRDRALAAGAGTACRATHCTTAWSACPSCARACIPPDIGSPRQGRPRHCRAGQSGAAAPHPHAHAGREGIPQPLRHSLALPLPRGAIRTSSRWRGRNTKWAICRRSPIPACSAATPTGAGPSGCRSTC